MVKTVKLDSGVRLVMEKIDYVRSVAIGIWVKAGACDEDKANAGISHYIEHMMFKGTANRTAREIAADIDKIGGQINAFTGKEATCYYVKSTGEHYSESADVLVDMLTNTLLDPKDMKRERNVIREEIKMNADDPDDLVHETVTSLVFKGSPLGNSILGTYTSLGRISRPVMKSYIEREYTRDSIVISVAGYFDEREVTEYFNDKLLTLTAEKEPKKVEIPEYKPGYRCITKDIEQTHICMATKAISLYDDRYYALSILSNIMGGSMSSRLFQNIREEKGALTPIKSKPALQKAEMEWNTAYQRPRRNPNSFQKPGSSSSAPISSTVKTAFNIKLVSRTTPPTLGAAMASCMVLRCIKPIRRPDKTAKAPATVTTPRPPI